jgi:hypothetical protein
MAGALVKVYIDSLGLLGNGPILEKEHTTTQNGSLIQYEAIIGLATSCLHGDAWADWL